MKEIAVRAAEVAFARASAAIQAINYKPDFADFESAWSDFLTASARIYSKLEQGSKESKPSSIWFGQKKHERRTDPLLKYIRYARNVDEHGLLEITARVEGAAIFPKGAFIGALPVGWGMHPVTFLPPGRSITITDPYLKLVTVIDDRTGRHDPPTTHLGTPIPEPSPLAVANLAMAYLENMIDEARKLT